MKRIQYEDQVALVAHQFRGGYNYNRGRPYQQTYQRPPQYYTPPPYSSQPPQYYALPQPYYPPPLVNYYPHHYQPRQQYQYQSNNFSKKRPNIQRPQVPPIISTPSIDQSQGCELCDKKGHLAKQCIDIGNFASYTSNTTLLQPNIQTIQQPTPECPIFPHSAMSAASTQSDSSWCLDSGASSHMTSNLGAFSSYESFLGIQFVIVRSGERLPITHIGSLILK